MKLEEILHNHLNPYFKGGAIERQAKEAMREAVKQALELAAERAKADYDDAYITDEEGEEWIGVGKPYVVKSSILSILDEIEE